MERETTEVVSPDSPAPSPPGGAENSVSMQLHAETILVEKRRIEELVRVTRSTDTKTVQVEEPLETNGVVVEHVHVGQFVEVMPPVREEGDTTVLPIVEEVAVVVKRLFLREELRITRTRTTSKHVETVTLREQHAHVTRTPLAARADALPALPKHSNSTGIPNMENEETIVAVYDTPAHAELAVGDLLQAKVPQSAISRHEGSSAVKDTAPVREQGFWSSLFGGEAEDEHVYEHSARAGSSVVVVKAPLHDVDAVMQILESHHPVNLDERAESYRANGSTPEPIAASTMTGFDASTSEVVNPPVTASSAAGAAATATTGDTVQLSEERLVVGKRLVNRGGTRLRRYVVETPVQEDVSLHSETVQVERRLVTEDVVANPDFSEKTIEMTASAEEAVVGKTAHVVEEVSLRKEATDRVETVHDTLRKEEVEVEQIPASTKVEGAPGSATKI